MEKEKILILSLGRTGSLPVYAEKITENFNSINYTIIVSKNRTKKNVIKNTIEIKTYNNKLSFVINTLFYLPIKLILLLPKMIREYNALYLPYQHFWDFPFIILFRLLRRRVVFTVHDGILHKGEKNFVSQFLSNLRLKLATELIYLTNYVRETVKKNYKIVKPFNIIPHPTIENNFINLNNRKNDTKNLLFFGRIDQYKGIELLMQAVAEVEGQIDKLIIAGKSQYKIKYLNHPKIEIRDKYLSEEEIGEVLSWADVLVLPYTEASQSGVIALGIYAELPMICSNIGGFSEQLNEDESFWCEAANVDSIKNSIKDAFNDDEKYLRIKEKLKAKKGNLTWKKISNNIESILTNTDSSKF